MKRALITGIQGFTGCYLATELSAHGYEVFGTTLDTAAGNSHIVFGDLADRRCLQDVVRQVRPDVVVHLAAISFVAHDDPEAIYRTNLLGTRNLLEALAASDDRPRAVLLASSANVYGNAVAACLDESSVPAPANDYAVSKLAMEYMAQLWQARLPLMIVRPFNYTGVGQAAQFLIPKIVAHFRDKKPVLELGNLDVARDFSDVRTVVNCYRRLIETDGARGIFNVCSGRAYSLLTILDMMRSIAGFSPEIRVNPAFVRANEVKSLVGSRTRLEATIGVVDDISLEETLAWMMDSHEC